MSGVIKTFIEFLGVKKMDYRPCAVCGGVGSEMHHIIRRSHCKAMVHAEINLIALCPKHHRHNTYGVHGKNKELDNKLKLELQNKLEMLFDKEYLTEDDINIVLKISLISPKKDLVSMY